MKFLGNREFDGEQNFFVAAANERKKIRRRHVSFNFISHKIFQHFKRIQYALIVNIHVAGFPSIKNK